MKKAFITGISGQDGSYLSTFLLTKGYSVHGLVRRSSTSNLSRIQDLLSHPNFHIHYGDMTDYKSLENIISHVCPNEIYNLAAQSFVAESFNQPEYTYQVNASGTGKLLELMKRYCPNSKFYQANSSELFGDVKETPQTEKTPFNPVSPYAISKLDAYYQCEYYKNAHELFICNGVLFNHESPRRGIEFVTKKITNTVAKIKLGIEEELRLGNLKSRRDWGHAIDYIQAMWSMLQQEQPDNYVIATNKSHTIEEFVDLAFNYVNLNYEDYVVIDEKFFRPAEVNILQGDYSKAYKKLGWQPNYTLQDLVKEMTNYDLETEKEKIS